MTEIKMPVKRARNSMIVVRVNAEQKALVVQAAEREGLQLSSFILMVLVRVRILPQSCLKALKRRPVACFTELHDLLGIVNKIGGNCKQLKSALPDVEGLAATHSQLIHAASVLTNALHGGRLPHGINLYHFQDELTKLGHGFNQAVKNVNMGRSDDRSLSSFLYAIERQAAKLSLALHEDKHIGDIIHLAIDEHTKRNR
ncbi:MAG: hypothetical protein PHW63_00120 [Alphaproteobacteria bacterium]|nr:hypothetical protein [Alphaproteobacteria bacterium]